MKFIFPYEVLIKYKKSLEGLKRKAYLESKKNVEDCHKSLDKRWEKKKEALNAMNRLKKSGGKKIGEIESLEDYIRGQDVHIKKEKSDLKDLMKFETEKHEAFKEALKEVKALELLRERKEKEFKESLRKKEIREIEELMIMGYGRKDRD